MTQGTVIQADKLTKQFGDFTAVDHISFEVGKGEIFGFLGANGAGKTTAMRMLCGLSLPTSGNANVAGFDVYKENEKIKRSIGYMSQKFSLYEDLTVKENVRFYAGIYGKTDKFIKEKTSNILNQLHTVLTITIFSILKHFFSFRVVYKALFLAATGKRVFYIHDIHHQIFLQDQALHK